MAALVGDGAADGSEHATEIAMPVLVCGVCSASSTDVAWNTTRTFKKGTKQEYKVPLGDACAECALTARKGSYPQQWDELKHKAAADPKFKLEFMRAGRIRSGSERASFFTQEVPSGGNWDCPDHMLAQFPAASGRVRVR
eukprot:2259570-Alexandrium_andersonii.AAC.1